MQAHYASEFLREMGCTEAEWRMWLPAALGDCPAVLGPASAEVCIATGRLDLSWEVLPPLRIALLRMPRLAVQFRFDRGVDEARRYAFMRRFDLYMQRGGG